MKDEGRRRRRRRRSETPKLDSKMYLGRNGNGLFEFTRVCDGTQVSLVINELKFFGVVRREDGRDGLQESFEGCVGRH